MQAAVLSADRRGEALRGLRASVPVMFGFIPFALVLGAQATSKGFSVAEVPLLTAMNFGGGSEFAVVGLWTSPPAIALVVSVTLLVNSRHLLMGAALSPYLRNLPNRIVLPALFFMCDESWAMGLADAKADTKGVLNLGYYLGVSAGLYATWVTFTAIGAMLGPVLGDVSRYGCDMAFPAVFFVLLRGMWRGLASAYPWIASLMFSVLVCVALPGAWYVPVGTLSGVAVAWWRAAR